MTVVLLLDIFSVLAVLAALPVLCFPRRRVFRRDSWWLLFGLLGLTLFRHVSNALEWSDITSALDVSEDYCGLLLPPAWFFLAYTVMRERAAEALRESEERYRQVVDTMSDGLTILDKDGAFLFVDAAFCGMYGYSREELVGMHVMEVIHPDYQHYVEKFVKAIEETGSYTHETVDVRKDGTTFFAEIHGGIIKFEGRECLLGVVRDISERKEAEKALRQNERFLENVFDALQDGLSVLDRDLRIVRVNRWMEQMYAHAGPLAGKKCYAVYQQRETACPWCPSLKAIETGSRQTREVPYPNAEEPKGWIELSSFPLRDGQGDVVGVIEYVKDVTQRKDAEAERERLMAAIEQATETILITDADGTILYVNPAFERTTGYSREEALGQTPRLLRSGKQDAVFYRDMWGRIAHGQPWTGQFTNRRKDGTLYQEEATISPVRDTSGRITNYVAVKRDVTREMELERRLRVSQRMEVIGTLAGGVAHDFNNILQAVLGHLALAMEDLPPKEGVYGHLRQVELATERAAALTRQLLAFSRQQVMQPEDLDLNQIIAGLLKMIRRIIGEDVRLDFIPGHQLGVVHVDPGQIEQVLMNLCVNARDAMPEGGDLTIESENVVIDGAYCETHPWAKAGRYVLLKVSDTGAGMDEATRQRVFEPFFTTKEVGKGTGLGLATVYGIVKQHDGTIQVYSEPGKGTVFKVYLPIVSRPARAVERTSEGPVPGGTETILVAEDDEAIRQLAVRALGRAGYTVLEAADGEEAVEVFKAHSDGIDLALFDVVMPKMSGPNAYRKLKAIAPGLRVLFSSGYSANGSHTRFALEEGAELLQKPYESKALLRKVRQVLDA